MPSSRGGGLSLCDSDGVSWQIWQKQIQRKYLDMLLSGTFRRMMWWIVLMIATDKLWRAFGLQVLAQIFLSRGGNIMRWHHEYIKPQDIADQIFTVNRKAKGEGIPRIIHQTYKSIEAVESANPEWMEGMKLWQHHHPNWKYKFWSDDEIIAFLEDHYSWFLPTFWAYKYPIQRVDVGRLFIVYHYGGVYSDLDIAPIQNIEPLLTDGVDVFLVETPNVGATNSLFGSIAKSDFLHYAIEHLHEYQSNGSVWNEHLHILFTTGPTALWTMYGRYSTDLQYSSDTEKIEILHRNHFGKCSVCSMSVSGCASLSRGAFFEHFHGNSWHGTFAWVPNAVLFCHLPSIGIALASMFKFRDIRQARTVAVVPAFLLSSLLITLNFVE